MTTAEASRAGWKQAQAVVHNYWKRWVTEYLPKLSEREKWRSPAKPLTVGTVVTFPDEQKKGKWIKGIVCEVFPGKDGQTRSARIRVGDLEVTKPTVKLAILDVHRGEEDSSVPKENNNPKEKENKTFPHWGRKRGIDVQAVKDRAAELEAIAPKKKPRKTIRTVKWKLGK